MAGFPPPPYPPPPGFDPRAQRRYLRDQARAQRDMYRAQARHLKYGTGYGMRRTSVLGPLLLVTAGVIFLLIQTGRLSPSRMWAWYGHWWPTLFLAGGLILLAEWGWDQRRLRDGSQPQYRRSIGGGVFTLLLVLAFVGVAADQAHRHFAGDHPDFGWHFAPDDLDRFLGDRHDSDQTLDLPLASGGSLEIVDPRGDVSVSGTSDDGRVHIAIHKGVYSRTDSEADTKARQLTPTSSSSGTGLTVTVPTVDGGRADLVVTLPAGTPATVTSNRGDIHIASIKSAVTATANHGDVELSGVSGPATIHVNNGGSSISAHSLGSGLTVQGHAQDVTLSDIAGPVTLSGEFFGTTHLEHIAGPVHFHTSRTSFQLQRLDGEVEISPHMDLTADGVLGPVVLTTSNRNITLDRVAGDVSVTNKNGSIDLTAAPGLGQITLENRNGSIKTILPSHAAFSVQASTVDGDITTDFGLAPTEGDSRKSMDGTVGAGGPTVRLTTVHGDISLNKGDVMPLPPEPPALPKLSALPVPPATQPVRGPAVRPAPPAKPKPAAVSEP